MNNKTQSSNSELLINLSNFNKGIKKPYQKLHHFREEKEQQPYQARQKKVLLYRMIFGCIGCVFLALFGLAYMQTSSSLFFISGAIPKISICTITILFALIAFSIGISIRTEKEAIANLAHRAQRKLKRIYLRKISQLNEDLIRLAYHDTVEKILEAKEASLTLVNEIAQTKNSSMEMSIELFNQAILELNDRLTFLINRFKNDPS